MLKHVLIKSSCKVEVLSPVHTRRFCRVRQDRLERNSLNSLHKTFQERNDKI